jgi:hypothetical protein
LVKTVGQNLVRAATRAAERAVIVTMGSVTPGSEDIQKPMKLSTNALGIPELMVVFFIEVYVTSFNSNMVSDRCVHSWDILHLLPLV